MAGEIAVREKEVYNAEIMPQITEEVVDFLLGDDDEDDTLSELLPESGGDEDDVFGVDNLLD